MNIDPYLPCTIPQKRVRTSCVTAIQRCWTPSWNRPRLQGILVSLSICVRELTLALPNPCDDLKDYLTTLQDRAKGLAKRLALAKRIVTEAEGKLIEIRIRYKDIDYRLAMMDGVRFQKISTEEVIKSRRKKEVKEIVRRLSDTQKKELLNELLR